MGRPATGEVSGMGCALYASISSTGNCSKSRITVRFAALLVAQGLGWRDVRCSSRGNVGGKNGHQKHRRHYDDVSQNVYSAGIEQHGIHELLEGETHRQPDQGSD